MLTVLLPENDRSPALRDLLVPLLPPGSDIRDPDDGLEDLAGRRLLFAVALDEGGCNMAYYRMLSRLRRSTDLLSDSIGACIVTGVGEFYTKDVARDMVFAANQAGCGFLGRPLVEATGSLRNFRTQAQIGGTDEVTAFHAAVAELLSRLDGWEKPAPIRHVLALHASQRATSNTLALWELVKAGLPADMEVQEICLRNGTMADCNGCSYTACLHFGEQGGCFYGGPMVDEVYPAVRKCDALVMLCANYNDALAQRGGERVHHIDVGIGELLLHVLGGDARTLVGGGEGAGEVDADDVLAGSQNGAHGLLKLAYVGGGGGGQHAAADLAVEILEADGAAVQQVGVIVPIDVDGQGHHGQLQLLGHVVGQVAAAVGHNDIFTHGINLLGSDIPRYHITERGTRKEPNGK